FKLLLRGSRDGFDANTFHRLCDNIPGLIVVLKVGNSNEILGGYNPIGWKSTNDGWKAAPNSFIFSLKNENMKQSILSRVKNRLNAIYHEKTHGSWFFNFGFRDSYGPKKWYYGKSNAYQLPIRNVADDCFSVDDYE
ncbi:5454_t:CDS:1, partial [Ambispora leptoticha]